MLVVELLEDRRTPATTGFSGGILTLDFASADEAIHLSNGPSGISLSGSSFGGAGAGPFFGVNRIDVADPTPSAGQTVILVGDALSLSQGLSIAGIETVQVTSVVSATGVSTIAIAAPTSLAFAAGSSLTTVDNTIMLTADQISIDASATPATISAGTATVTIKTFTAGRAIDLGGADSGTHLGLTDAELDRVTAGLVLIGDANAGTIAVSSNVTSTNALTLATGGDIDADRLLATDGDALSLSATGDISLAYALATSGGAINVVADSDANGAGTLTIAMPQVELVDPNPAPGNQFGHSVVVLPSGNVVVTAPYDDIGGANAGAVYLFNGFTGELISTLHGSSAGDNVGVNGVTALANGNYVVRSNIWDNGTATDAGAVTWGHGTVGVSGVVSDSNSLVGNAVNDQVGVDGVTALTNGNYVVRSSDWDNGATLDAGAITWGNGTTGVSGVVTPGNSLVGTTANDSAGSSGVIALTNGNYVVFSTGWDNGTAANAGAVTWGSGTAGVSGIVNASNSLVGNTASDQVGSGGVTALPNGNYVVISPFWNNGAVSDVGAATWGNGLAGITGLISVTNSLVGGTANDSVGSSSGLTILLNGNYVVRSPRWSNSAASDVGAVTWGSSTTGVSGVVSASNSLVGTTALDKIGSTGVTALTNGNYVVISSTWRNGAAANAGAVTWGSGTTGVSGIVSVSNSLVGSAVSDQVGVDGVTALTNGNYVVKSRLWDGGTTDNVGAVTWGSGTTGITGVVSASNSLVGGKVTDMVGNGGVTALTNGNYVVRSQNWDGSAAQDAGAVTWGSGTTGVSGLVSASNSLVGSTEYDQVGGTGVTALTNGNYVVRSANWDHGTAANAGAATWGSGATGISGLVSTSNSLFGSAGGDQVGSAGVTALTNGNYVVSSHSWDSGAVVDAGAVTWGNGAIGLTGAVSSSNSLFGGTKDDRVGFIGVTALTDGNYVVNSPFWINGTAAMAGAVTWGSGTAGISGMVSPHNSLVGGTAGDRVGADANTSNTVTALRNGNYVVRIPLWDNCAAVDAGAVTWGSGATGVSGVVGPGNSFLGMSANSSLGTVIVGNPSDLFVARFLTDDSGRILLGSQALGQNYGLHAGGGTVSLGAGVTAGVQPLTPGLDVTASSTSFASGTGLHVAIAGTTRHLQYAQFTAGGAVDLTGTDLVLTGAYVPVLGNAFTVVAATNVTGLFNGRANGSYFPFNGVHLRIDYSATAVTLTAAAPNFDIYIDDDWSAMSLGQEIADADPTSSGNQPATFGLSAFASASGLEAVGPSHTATIFPGTYPQSAHLIAPISIRVPSGNITLNGVLVGAGGFEKTGNGTLVLGSANALIGGLTVNRGKLQFSADASLGDASNTISVNAPGEIVVTGNAISSRSFDLNDGTLSLIATKTLTLSGGEILGGFVKGPGTIATTAEQAASFVGTTFRNSLTVAANGDDLFANVSNAGIVSVAAGSQIVTLSGFINEGTGQLISGAGSTTNLDDFLTYGQLVVAGAVVNVGSAGLGFSAGSTTTIDAGGEIDIGSGSALVAGGLVKNFGKFGSTGNSVIVDFGGKVIGNGTFYSVVTQNGGVYSPGGSPGSAAHAVYDINGGGIFEFEIANAAGTAGALDGWDTATVAPNVYSPSSAELILSATTANKYTIVLTTRINTGDRNAAGAAANFNPAQNYAWKFLDGSHLETDVTGTFDAAAFNVVTSGFQNAATGTFAVELRDSGKNLYVVYNAPALTPTVSSIAPVIGPTRGGTLVTILGTSFTSITSVTFDGFNAATFIVISATQINAITAAHVGVGAVEVVVTNSVGSGSLAGTNDFTFTPSVSSFVVNGGPGVVFSASTFSLAGQHSVVKQILVTFQEAVTVASDAFTVTRRTQNVTVNGGAAPSTVAVVANSVTMISASEYLVTFSGPGTHAGGVIDSGVYDLTTLASKVTVGAQTMAANQTTTFFALFGNIEANNRYNGAPITQPIPQAGYSSGNGHTKAFVDPGSLFRFSDTFGSRATAPAGPPAYDIVFDYNLDGSIDPGDLFAFSDSFGIDWNF